MSKKVASKQPERSPSQVPQYTIQKVSDNGYNEMTRDDKLMTTVFCTIPQSMPRYAESANYTTLAIS
ncbi:MAG: hypothetical protein ACRC2T_19535 [Thermoguttaceae bacterium]